MSETNRRELVQTNGVTRLANWLFSVFIVAIAVQLSFNVSQVIFDDVFHTTAIRLGMLVVLVMSFLLGVLLARLMSCSSALSGSIAAFFPLMVMNEKVNQRPDIDVIQHPDLTSGLLLIGIAVVALVSGRNYRQTSKMLFIAAPIVWTTASLLAIAAVV